MKVIVIGAGIGGLQVAKLLAKANVSVELFETKKREELAYDWIDDVETKVFNELNIPLPDGYFRTANVTFAPPFSSKLLMVDMADEKRDWSIERRPFSEILVALAIEAGVSIHFETKVDALTFSNERVTGISIGDKTIEADLVIDSSGVYSAFRSSLPKSFGIESQPKSGEVFRAYRAFYKPNEGVDVPLHKKIIYLKHLGEQGISWCVVEPNKDVNVLVGRTDALSKQTLDKAIDALRCDNPILSDKMLRGGICATIPIRYPLSRMVANGYAAIGDAAFMTIPLIGSGIANSLRAGQILAETLLEHKASDICTLWEYQYKYFIKIGAPHVSVDYVKRTLLSMSGDDIKFLFESGVVSETELNGIASGEKLIMKLPQIMSKLKKGGRKLKLLLALATAISKSEKAEAHAKSIPQIYDVKKVRAWQDKLDGYFTTK